MTGDDRRPFAIRWERSSLGTALWVTGTLDIESAEALGAAIVEAGRHHSRVVVELSEVDSIDAAALGAMVGAAKQGAGHTAIILRHPNSLVTKVLQLIHLDQVFEIEG